MAIETTRDIVVIILGILWIIITIGLLVGLFIAYFKIKKFALRVNQSVSKIRIGLAYIRGMAKGFNESIKIFKGGS